MGVGWGWRRSRGEGGEPGKEGAPGPLRRPARPGVSCSPSPTPASKSAGSEKGRGGQRLPPSAARGTRRRAASPPHPGNPLPRRPATEAASWLHPGTRALLSHPPPASRVPLCPSFAGGWTIPREEGERFGPSGRQQPQVMGRCLGPPRCHPVSMGGVTGEGGHGAVGRPAMPESSFWLSVRPSWFRRPASGQRLWATVPPLQPVSRGLGSGMEPPPPSWAGLTPTLPTCSRGLKADPPCLREEMIPERGM